MAIGAATMKSVTLRAKSLYCGATLSDCNRGEDLEGCPPADNEETVKAFSDFGENPLLGPESVVELGSELGGVEGI